MRRFELGKGIVQALESVFLLLLNGHAYLGLEPGVSRTQQQQREVYCNRLKDDTTKSDATNDIKPAYWLAKVEQSDHACWFSFSCLVFT